METTGGARRLALGAHPAQALDEQRLVRERGRLVDQRVELGVVKVFPPFAFWPVGMTQLGIYSCGGGLRFYWRHRGMFRRAGGQHKNKRSTQR